MREAQAQPLLSTGKKEQWWKGAKEGEKLEQEAGSRPRPRPVSPVLSIRRAFGPL